MPLTRSEKDKLIAEYQGGLAVAPHAFLLGFKGISVPQVTELRNRVRATGGEYLVVKNTLALRAIDSTALAALQEHFVGPTAVVYTDHDPVALAKALTDYAKEVPALEFKAGMVERRALAAGQIKEIAQLPSREQLIAKLLYLLQSPITRFARLLAALPRSLVVVLDQVSKKKEESGGAAGATEAPAATAAAGAEAPAAAEAPQAAAEPEAAAPEAAEPQAAAPEAAEPQAAAPEAAGETEAKGTTEGAAGG